MPPAPLDSWLYRAALYLYPPAFRREFAAEMTRDFIDARPDVRRSGRAHELWAFRAHMAADLLGAVVTQWIRTGLPVIVLMAVTATSLALSAFARVWPSLTFSLPAGTPNADTISLVLLVTVVLLVIVATIIFTLWFTQRYTRPIPRRRIILRASEAERARAHGAGIMGPRECARRGVRGGEAPRPRY